MCVHEHLGWILEVRCSQNPGELALDWGSGLGSFKGSAPSSHLSWGGAQDVTAGLTVGSRATLSLPGLHQQHGRLSKCIRVEEPKSHRALSCRETWNVMCTSILASAVWGAHPGVEE